MITLYERLGGEAGVAAIVDAFYNIVETDPRAEPLHRLHLRGHGVAHARREQFDFLSGFLGGPRHYNERHGRADVRSLHAHVAIDSKLRDLWLDCMAQALECLPAADAVKAEAMRHFRRAAEIVRNTDQ